MHLLDSSWVWGSWLLASLGFGYYVITKLNSNSKTIKANAKAIASQVEIMVRQTDILRDNRDCMLEMIELMRFDAEESGKKPPPYVRKPRDNHKL